MILIPQQLRDRLRTNASAKIETDHVPVVKLFDPCGAATWLATELMADGDTLLGLADLGFGCPELGSFSLSEIENVKGVFGLGIERDMHFVGRFALSVYAQAAYRAGRIVEAQALLHQAALMLGKHQSSTPEIPPSENEGGG